MPAKELFPCRPNQLVVNAEDGTPFLAQYALGVVEIYEGSGHLIYRTELIYDARPEQTLQMICSALLECFNPSSPVELVYKYGGWTPASQTTSIPLGRLLC